MEPVVVWSDLAETQVENIHAFYLFTVSRNTADRLVDKIITSTDILKNHPGIGQREEVLMHHEEEFRYLVIGHYKVIYRIMDSITVRIYAVFDCRQDPEKLKELFK